MNFKETLAIFLLVLCIEKTFGKPTSSKLSSFVDEYERNNKNKDVGKKSQQQDANQDGGKEVVELKSSASSEDDFDDNSDVSDPSMKKFNDGPPSAKDVDPNVELNLDTGSSKKHNEQPTDPNVIKKHNEQPTDPNVMYYDQNMNLVHDEDETRKLFGRGCVAGDDKEDLIDVLGDPNFKLSAGEYKKIGDKFEKSVRKILPESTDFPKEKTSKDILADIKKELSERRKILEAVANTKTFEDVSESDKSVEQEINKILLWIRHYKAQEEEQKRFKRMLDAFDNSGLTELDKIVINVYSRDPQVNAFLLKPSSFKEGQGKCTLKAHAKLLQNALHKMKKYNAKMLVRIDSNWKKSGEEPLASRVESFLKFTSTMNISHLKGEAVDDEIKKIALHKKNRLLIRFVDPSQGYEIAPWVKTQYLMSQREVLYPVGATFEVEKKLDTKTKDKEFPINYDLYKFIYDLTDVPSSGI